MGKHRLILLKYLAVAMGFAAGGLLAQQPADQPDLSPPPKEIFDSESQVSISIGADYDSASGIPSTIYLRVRNDSDNPLTFQHRNGIVGPFVMAIRHRREWLIDMHNLDMFRITEGYPETSQLVLQPDETKTWKVAFTDLLDSDVDINALPNPEEIHINARSVGLYIQDDESEYESWPFKPLQYSVGLWE